MPLFDEEPPKKKKIHEIGEDLATFSLEELADRIAVLRAEIVRLEQDIAAKQASAKVAATFFKR